MTAVLVLAVAAPLVGAGLAALRAPAVVPVGAALVASGAWLAVLLDGAGAALGPLAPDLIGAAAGAGTTAVAAGVASRPGLAPVRVVAALAAAAALGVGAAAWAEPSGRAVGVAVPVLVAVLVPGRTAAARVACAVGGLVLAGAMLPGEPAAWVVWSGALAGAVAVAAAQPAAGALAPIVLPAAALGVTRLTGLAPSPGWLAPVLAAIAAVVAALACAAGRGVPRLQRGVHPAVPIGLLALAAIASDLVPADLTPVPPAGSLRSAGLLLAAAATLGGAAGRGWTLVAALPGGAALAAALLAADLRPAGWVLAGCAAVAAAALASSVRGTERPPRSPLAAVGPWAARLGILHLALFPTHWRWTGSAGLVPWRDGALVALAGGLAAAVLVIAWRARPGAPPPPGAGAGAGRLAASRRPVPPAAGSPR